ncbi:hypothetical protein OVA24_14465 [Luteolibacter sp. SL250]|uniref:hypothetical protein n=1 Tax=Luteolibacter sp. SL250 TaxID=2995170 RepID=UPI00226E8FCA|nr:hypothetical protein [Luteolibacter sp. SL250]WAC18435.1 hypothetical protein OVA24_14465 [Luteolibacter sp. SL250]
MTNRALITGVLSAAVTIAAWAIAWPRGSASRNPSSVPEKETHPTPPRIDPTSTITALREAKTPEEKLAAAARLHLIPVERIPELLESFPVMENKWPAFATQALLIRWASKDGAAAMEWLWKTLPDRSYFPSASRDIRASWAWHDPEGLARWAEDHLQRTTPDEKPPNDSSPKIDSSQLSQICLWLVPHDPYLACTLRKKAGGSFSSQDVALAQAIPTVEKVRQALRAYDDLDQLSSTKISGHQMIPMQLLRRWQELDPEDFARSPYGHVMPVSVHGGDYLRKNAWRTLSAEKRANHANAIISGKDGDGRAAGIYQIASQWAEVDPAGTASWLESLPRSEAKQWAGAVSGVIAPKDLPRALALLRTQEPAAYRSSLVRAFDAWTKQHPDTPADLSGQDELTQQVWRDLQALGRE